MRADNVRSFRAARDGAVAIRTVQRKASEWMDAVRCLECGATRWALFGPSFEHMLHEPCEVCGGETVVERRRPGTGAARPVVERRDLEEHTTR